MRNNNSIFKWTDDEDGRIAVIGTPATHFLMFLLILLTGVEIGLIIAGLIK